MCGVMLRTAQSPVSGDCVRTCSPLAMHPQFSAGLSVCEVRRRSPHHAPSRTCAGPRLHRPRAPPRRAHGFWIGPAGGSSRPPGAAKGERTCGSLRPCLLWPVFPAFPTHPHKPTHPPAPGCARQSEEFLLRARAGVPPAELIAAATSTCAALFGMDVRAHAALLRLLCFAAAPLLAAMSTPRALQLMAPPVWALTLLSNPSQPPHHHSHTPTRRANSGLCRRARRQTWCCGPRTPAPPAAPPCWATRARTRASW